MLARCLVDLRSDYEGRPLRWSPTVVELVPTDLVPRKLLLDPDQAAALPAALEAFLVRYAAARTGLGPSISKRSSLPSPTPSAPSSTAWATRRLPAFLQARGVPLDDPEAIDAALGI